MHILLVNNTKIPALKYGGTERVIWSLGKALVALGHQVSYLVAKGSYCPFAMVYEYRPGIPLKKQLPPGIDVVHLHFPVAQEPDFPYLVTIHGNGEAGEQFRRNTIFLTADHAKRHHSPHFVYNGLDFDEYGPVNWKTERKHLLFLAKTSRKEKNIQGAMDIARFAGEKLEVIGGRKLVLSNKIRFRGQVGGPAKSKLLNTGKALLFPVRWHEPFGLAPIEALYFGNPVFATPYGSMPELIKEEVGYLSAHGHELAAALEQLPYFSRKLCHHYAVDNFNHLTMAGAYLKYYEKVLQEGLISQTEPFVAADQLKTLLAYDW